MKSKNKGVLFLIKYVHIGPVLLPIIRSPKQKVSQSHPSIHVSTKNWRYQTVMTLPHHYVLLHYTLSPHRLSFSLILSSLPLSPIRGLVSSGFSQNAGTLSRKSSQSDPSDFPSGFVSDFPFHFLHFLCFNSELSCFPPFHSQRGLSQLLSTM
jgi:hypothetical protein